MAMPTLTHAQNEKDETIHLEKYGQILKSDYGETPPVCVTEALESRGLWDRRNCGSLRSR